MVLEHVLSALVASKRALASIAMLVMAIATSTGLAALYMALMFKLREHGAKAALRDIFPRAARERHVG